MDSTDIAQQDDGDGPAMQRPLQKRKRSASSVAAAERNETDHSGRFTAARASAMGRRSRVSMSDLPLYLERVTARGLRVIDKILLLPIDGENGPLIRAQVTAALGVVSAQLRADEARLKRQVAGDALARLLKLIDSEKRLKTKSIASEHEDAAGQPGDQEAQSELGAIVELVPEPSHEA